MAQETIGELMIRMGLSYDELNQDFVAVEETLSANIERLNRENRLIQLKANIDLAGVTEAADKLKIQQAALTQQIELQTQKVKLYEAEWRSAAKANGEASKQAQKAEIALRQQEMALEKLKQKLQAVTAQQQELGKSAASGAGGGILDVLSNIKGDISGGVSKLANTFGELKEASGSAGGALSKAVELISGIPSPAGKAVAALAAIPLVIKGIESSILSMSEQAMTQGDSFYVLSRGLQVSIDEAKELSMVCKVTGIEISEVAATTKRVATSFLRAGDNANLMTKTLQRYGVELKNSNGEMKNTLEMSKALAAGLAKAQAEGQGKEFIASVFGRFASGDYITYLEDLAGNIEFAKKVIKSKLEDPVLAHAVQGEMNALKAQIDEAGNAFSYALLPVANKIIPELREQFGALTKVIADNAEGIRDMGYAFGEVVAAASSLVTGMAELAAISAKVFAPVGQKKAKYDIFERYRKDTSIKSFNDLLQKELARMSTDERRLLEMSERQYTAYVNFLRSVYPELKKLHEGLKEEETKSWANFKQANDKIFSDEEIQRSLERVKKYTDELAHIKIDLQFGNDSYGKSIAELDLEYQQRLEKAEGFLGEQQKLEEWYAAKRELIERQHAEKTAKIREDSLKRANNFLQDAADREYALTHDALEKQIYDIERWKQAQLEKAQTAEEVAATIADAASREAEAFEREMDRVQGRIESGQDRLARLTLSQRDYDLYKAFKDYQEDLKNLPRAIADVIYAAQMKQIDERTGNDKSGKYSEGKGFDVSALLNADPRRLAAMKTLESYGIGTDELKKALGNTTTAQEAYRNILQRATAGMSADTGNLGKAFTGVANGVSNLGNTAEDSAKKVASAAETVKLALEMVAGIEEAGIEEENERRKAAQSTDEGRIPIIYGNEDYSPYADNNGIEIIYGNLEDFGNSLGDLSKTTAEMIREYAATMDSAPIENFQQEVTNSAGATQNLANAADTAGTSTNAFSEKLNQTADTLDALREKIANTPLQQPPLQQPPQQPQQYDNFSDSFDDALKATATIGELTALGGLATLQPQIALLGTGIEALANTAQTLRDLAKHVPAQPTQSTQPTAPQPATPQPNSPTSVDLSEIQTTLTTISQTLNTIAQEPPVDLTPLQEELQQLAENPALAEINTSIQGMSTELSAKLAEIAQGISALAQSAGNNRQPPQVNVNVNPNINLGGAYVFDNAMKQQLTDDIATEVADAVTSAVQTATKQADYGYGN